MLTFSAIFIKIESACSSQYNSWEDISIQVVGVQLTTDEADEPQCSIGKCFSCTCKTTLSVTVGRLPQTEWHKRWLEGRRDKTVFRHQSQFSKTKLSASAIPTNSPAMNIRDSLCSGDSTFGTNHEQMRRMFKLSRRMV